MNTVLDDLEGELRRAVAANARRRKLTLPTRWHVERHRPRLAAVALGVALLASATALAAGGVIPFGSPTRGGREVHFGMRSGAVIPGSVELLGVRAPDPAGGLPWGMRVFDTRRGEGCLEVGRLEDGKLGAIGADDAFHDDGRFHVFAPNTVGAEQVCGLRDAAGRLFLNGSVRGIPASAWTGEYRNLGCVAAHVTRAERYIGRSPLPTCPASSERDVYYGLLGPDAQSVTYAVGGERRTIPTVGRDGAYVIVTRHERGTVSNFRVDLRFDEAAPLRGPITEIDYRGGQRCRLVDSGIRSEQRCSSGMKLPVGWVAPKPPPSAAAAASPVHVRLVQAKHGYEAVVSFVSKVELTNARSFYTVEWRESGNPPGVAAFGSPEPAYPRRGERVTERLRNGLRGQLKRGPLTGKVTLDYRTSVGEATSTKRLVGRFAITVPR